MPTLTDDLHQWAAKNRAHIKDVSMAPWVEPIGRVLRTGDGVATVSGLPETRLDELLVFEGGVRGLVVGLGETKIGCVLLGCTSPRPGFDGAGCSSGAARPTSSSRASCCCACTWV
ncbi:MAG: hypothetical protein ABJ201_06900 [Nisaea sp.]